MKTNLIKWLSALLIACLVIFAPLALMEETPEPSQTEAPETALENYVEEITLTLGEESPAAEDALATEDAQELTEEGTEIEAVTVDAEEAATTSNGIPIDPAHFPDTTFRGYVLETIDTNKDEWLSEDEIKQTKTVDVRYSDITSLQGIEYFTYLEELDCGYNKITALDLSKNTLLEYLDCEGNELYALDVSKNTLLKWIYCDTNYITSLNVTNNTKLQMLFCDGNALSSLNVSKNTELQELSCCGNALSSLDVSKNTELQWLWCSENRLTVLDVSKNKKLTYLECDYNKLTTLDISHNPDICWLSCVGNNIATLDIRRNPVLSIFFRYVGRETRDDFDGEGGFDLDTNTLILSGFIPLDENHFPDANFRDYIKENIDHAEYEEEDKELCEEYFGTDLEYAGIEGITIQRDWLSEDEIINTKYIVSALYKHVVHSSC